MKKIIKEIDEKRGIYQVTIADERWYMKSVTSKTGIPEYKAVPSVTWIAQSYPKGIQYFKWLAEKGWDEAEAIKTQAGDKGTKVHLAIDDIFQGKEVRIDSKYVNKSLEREEELTLEECDAILSFLAWKAEMEKGYVLETIAWEKVIFSEKHNYAGSIDWIVKMTDKETGESQVWIIDFKTSQQVWTSHELQVSAYKQAIENGENELLHNQKIVDVSNLKIGILQLGYRRAKCGYKFTEIEDQFDMFLTAQKIWKKEHGTETPTKKDYPIVLSEGLKVDDIINQKE